MNPVDLDNPPSNPENAEKRLRAGETIRVRTATASMRPTLPPGEIVSVRPGRPVVGDAVLIKLAAPRDGVHFILHRLVARIPIPTRDYAVHAGDAPDCRPALCRESQIIGIAELPRARYTIRFQLRKTLETILQAVITRLKR